MAWKINQETGIGTNTETGQTMAVQAPNPNVNSDGSAKSSSSSSGGGGSSGRGGDSFNKETVTLYRPGDNFSMTVDANGSTYNKYINSGWTTKPGGKQELETMQNTPNDATYGNTETNETSGVGAPPEATMPNTSPPPAPTDIPEYEAPNLDFGGSNPYDNSDFPTYEPTPGTIGAGDVQPNQNLMSDTMANFSSMRGVLDMMSRATYNNKPTIKDVVNTFKNQVGGYGGNTAIDPTLAGKVITGEKNRKLQTISDMYKSTLRTVNTMEEMRIDQINRGQEMLMNLGEMGLLGEVTGEEYNEIMQGQTPITVLQKMAGLQERDMVEQLALRYPTAGINIKDSLDIASEKIGNVENKGMVQELSMKYPEANISLKDSYETALRKTQLLAQSRSDYEREKMEWELKNNYNLDLYEYNTNKEIQQNEVDYTNKYNEWKYNANKEDEVKEQASADRTKIQQVAKENPGAGIDVENDSYQEAIDKVAEWEEVLQADDKKEKLAAMGAKKIASPSELYNIKQKYGITPENEGNYIYRDPDSDDMWLLPQEEKREEASKNTSNTGSNSGNEYYTPAQIDNINRIEEASGKTLSSSEKKLATDEGFDYYEQIVAHQLVEENLENLTKEQSGSKAGVYIHSDKWNEIIDDLMQTKSSLVSWFVKKYSTYVNPRYEYAYKNVTATRN